jgi:trehalose utilization protein
MYHGEVTDEEAYRVYKHVLNGMGFIPLHSAHRSKPFYTLMGTECTLRWRDWAEHCRIWNVNPTHPIAKDIPMDFELEHEEMYGEYFNIPKPDDLIFVTWYAGGEIFRGGCTFTRGNGKIFYFHPGHEDCPSYHNPTIIKIIKNAIYWAAPSTKRDFKSGDFKLPNEKITKILFN